MPIDGYDSRASVRSSLYEESSLARKMCPGFRDDVSSASNNPARRQSLRISVSRADHVAKLLDRSCCPRHAINRDAYTGAPLSLSIAFVRRLGSLFLRESWVQILGKRFSSWINVKQIALREYSSAKVSGGGKNCICYVETLLFL